MSEKEKVEGYVEHIIFRNEENGYTVLNLSMKGRELTCVGTLPMIGEGELIEASGDYIEHAAYGKQFRIESYETKVPQDSVALERYLGSGAIKGVGAALAARIVRRFGDDTLRIIEEEPERLAEVKGISERKAREIAQQVAEKAEMQNAMIFLSGYGIALNLGAKIYQQYGDNVYRILKENPYKMAEDIAGVGFRKNRDCRGQRIPHQERSFVCAESGDGRRPCLSAGTGAASERAGTSRRRTGADAEISAGYGNRQKSGHPRAPGRTGRG